MKDQTIPNILQHAAQTWPDHAAIIESDTRISFNDLHQKALEAAGAIVASGLNHGDRFSIWAPNIHEWVWVALGGLMAGGILVPLNTRYRGMEAGDILRRSKSQLLFTTLGFLDTDYPELLKNESLPDLKEIILLRGENDKSLSMADFLTRSDNESRKRAEQRNSELSPDDTSDILYTSGTTGAPKGVVSSHGQTVRIFDAWSTTVGLQHGDQYLVVNPYFHSFGYKAGWLSCLIKGATNHPMAIYTPDVTLELIASKHISVLPGAPTIFQTLLASPKLGETNITSLRCSITGAASVPEQLVHDMKNILGFDEVFTAYGLTECPVVSITQPGDDIEIIANTSGKAIANTELRVVNEHDTLCNADEVGRIQVRGFNVMRGYFEDLQTTRETISPEGWLDTGDLGWMNANGYVKVTDRAKDMYISGGFNCYPAEIENLLLAHKNIIDVAVIGVAEERLGEVGTAYIVVDTDVTHTTLTTWAREHMANFKVPRTFITVNELPRNASGKVQKFLLPNLEGQSKVL